MKHKSIALLNGEFIDKDSSRKFKYNINVYEALRVQDGVVLFAEDHFDRMQNSLTIANNHHPISFTTWENRLYDVIEKNKVINGNIRTDLFISNENEVDEYITIYDAKYPTIINYLNGVETILQFDERINPNAKITNTAVRGKAESLIGKANVYETILVDHDQNITEGSRTNIFAIKDGQLITAPNEMVLCGIMRSKVLLAAEKLNIEVSQISIKTSDLPSIDALFLSGTSPRVLSINKVGDNELKVVHPLVKLLYEQIEVMVKEYVKRKKKS